MSIVNYESKYLKYKAKYEELIKLIGGSNENIDKLNAEYVERKKVIQGLQSELKIQEANLDAMKKLHANWQGEATNFKKGDVIPKLEGKQGFLSKDVDKKFLTPNAIQIIENIKDYIEKIKGELNQEINLQSEEINKLEVTIRGLKSKIKEEELLNTQNKKTTDRLKKEHLNNKK